MATRVLAHRGFHGAGGIVENTMPAFERAIKVGAIVELDVRRTLDGVLVVHHDPKLLDGRKIKKLLASELPLFSNGSAIPRFDDVIQLAKSRNGRVAVELKERGYEQDVLGLLKGALPTSQFEITSFSGKALKTVKGVDPTIRTGLLAPRIPGFLRESALYPGALWVLDKLHLEPALSRAVRAGADYVSVDYRMATPRFLEAAAKRHMPVDVWTVNDVPTMRNLVAQRVQGLVTDRPDLAIPIAASGVHELTRMGNVA